MRLSVAVLIVLVLSTALQMVIGEIAPKNLAIARTIPLARAEPLDAGLPDGRRVSDPVLRRRVEPAPEARRVRARRGAGRRVTTEDPSTSSTSAVVVGCSTRASRASWAGAWLSGSSRVGSP